MLLILYVKGLNCTTMLGSLGYAKQFGSMNILFDVMVSYGCMPNVVTSNNVIHSYDCSNYLNELVNVFYKTREVPNVHGMENLKGTIFDIKCL